MGEMRNKLGEPEGKRQLGGTLEYRGDDHIRMQLEETGWDGVPSQRQGRALVDAVMNVGKLLAG
jgi:hypothetical protein